MRYRVRHTHLLAVFVLSFVALSFASDEVSQGTPSAFVPMLKHKFDPVLEGSEVIHDFVIQNRGDATLTIRNVKTD